jgi:DNA-binding CsgD family transcriptional regulator
MADADLARLGMRTAALDDLTETEARAAHLAADGRTNREIGDLLFLTPKSVEGVLGRVYGKLGIRRRSELASRLAARADD